MRDEFIKALDKKLANIPGVYVDIISGDIHRQVGGYPGRNHSIPTCCDVMYAAMNGDDEVLYAPPKKRGATVKVRYYKKNHC